MPKIPVKVIGIVGSRRRASGEDFKILLDVFNRVYLPGDSIVSGGCPVGGDEFAERIARGKGCTITVHHPRKEDLDTELERVNPRAAWAKVNYARNTLIARDADVLLALVAADRTGGTEDTIKKALKFGKEVIYV